jgi:hypothetical protein
LKGKFIHGAEISGPGDAFIGDHSESLLIDVQSQTPTLRVITMGLGGLAFKLDVIETTPLPGVALEPDEIVAQHWSHRVHRRGRIHRPAFSAVDGEFPLRHSTFSRRARRSEYGAGYGTSFNL